MKVTCAVKTKQTNIAPYFRVKSVKRKTTGESSTTTGRKKKLVLLKQNRLTLRHIFESSQSNLKQQGNP